MDLTGTDTAQGTVDYRENRYANFLLCLEESLLENMFGIIHLNL